MADTILQWNGHPIKLIDNGDGTFSLGVEDSNLDSGLTDLGVILTAIKNTDGVKKITDTVNTKAVDSALGFGVSDSQTRPANTTAYAALDVVGEDPGDNISFASVVPTAGDSFIILSAKIRIDISAIPSGMTGFRLHLYNAAPTVIADNAAYNLPSADRAKYLGYISITDLSDVGDTVWAQADAVNFMGKSVTTTIYGILQTIGAFTPSSGAVKTITLNVAAV